VGLERLQEAPNALSEQDLWMSSVSTALQMAGRWTLAFTVTFSARASSYSSSVAVNRTSLLTLPLPTRRTPINATELAQPTRDRGRNRPAAREKNCETRLDALGHVA
jgi:hypothetical protein